MSKQISFTKLLALITAISVIISICLVAANASSGTVYEDESKYATVTADDKDNYGKISYESDTDFWEITFTEEGMANIWLGNIPTNCDYDIFICYKEDDGSLKEITCSEKRSKKAELMRCHVYPNVTYYVIVHPFNYSCDDTSYYLLRIKNYPLDGGSINGKLFYANYSGYSTAQGITSATSQLWNMGFNAGYYQNNTAGPAYSVLPNTTIFVTANDGWSGQLYFHDSMNVLSRTTLYAKPPATLLSTDRAITSLPAKGLSNVHLAILLNPFSGATNSTYGNLVDEILKKEAFVCIGWTGNVTDYDQNNWLELFLSKCTQNKTIKRALMDTNNSISADSSYSSGITNIYTGNSRLDAFALN